MKREDQEYYEKQLDMFLHPGWAHFVGQVQGMIDATDTIKGVSAEDLKFRQGELSIMQWIVGWPEQLKKAYEDLQEESNADI